MNRQHVTAGIDTPDDLAAARAIFETRLDPAFQALAVKWETWNDEGGFEEYMRFVSETEDDAERVEMIRDTILLAGRMHNWVTTYGGKVEELRKA